MVQFQACGHADFRRGVCGRCVCTGADKHTVFLQFRGYGDGGERRVGDGRGGRSGRGVRCVAQGERDVLGRTEVAIYIARRGCEPVLWQAEGHSCGIQADKHEARDIYTDVRLEEQRGGEQRDVCVPAAGRHTSVIGLGDEPGAAVAENVSAADPDRKRDDQVSERCAGVGERHDEYADRV